MTLGELVSGALKQARARTVDRDPRKGRLMHEHESVEVRSSYEGAWTAGFDVVEEVPAGYRLRRVSDGAVLPGSFATENVRAVEI